MIRNCQLSTDIVSYQLTKTNYQFDNIGIALSDIIIDNIIRVHPLVVSLTHPAASSLTFFFFLKREEGMTNNHEHRVVAYT